MRLAGLLSRLPDLRKKGVVYQIPCSNCDQVYTGESKRILKVRMSEHKRAVKTSDPNNGIAVHVAKSQHSIDWSGARVVRSVQGYWESRTMEAIEIKKSKSSMNLDKGLLLPSLWNPVLDQTYPPHTHTHTPVIHLILLLPLNVTFYHTSPLIGQ